MNIQAGFLWLGLFAASVALWWLVLALFAAISVYAKLEGDTDEKWGCLSVIVATAAVLTFWGGMMFG